MMVPPRIIRSYDIFPPLVGTQQAAQKLALAAAVFPSFRLWTNSLDSMPYFRDEVKAVHQVSTAKIQIVSSVGPIEPLRNTTTNCRTAWRSQPAPCAVGSLAAFRQSGPVLQGKTRPDADSRSPTEFCGAQDNPPDRLGCLP